MKHVGNLEITKENAEQYKDLVEVTGYLYISSNAKLDAAKLQTVGGNDTFAAFFKQQTGAVR